MSRWRRSLKIDALRSRSVAGSPPAEVDVGSSRCGKTARIVSSLEGLSEHRNYELSPRVAEVEVMKGFDDLVELVRTVDHRLHAPIGQHRRQELKVRPVHL